MTDAMNHVSDPPTAAQVAQILERLNNLSEDNRELKNMMGDVIAMRRDAVHMDEKVRRLFDIADKRTPEMARMDKRLASLERWHKFVGALALSSLGLVGWGLNRIDYLYKMDTRISMLELIVNGHSIEKSMETPKISGPK